MQRDHNRDILWSYDDPGGKTKEKFCQAGMRLVNRELKAAQNSNISVRCPGFSAHFSSKHHAIVPEGRQDSSRDLKGHCHDKAHVRS